MTKHNNHISLLLAVHATLAYLFLASPVFSQGQSLKLVDAMSAVQAVYQYAGVRPPTSLNAATAQQMATQVTLVDTTTPFLAPLLNGRAAWRINLGMIDFGLDSVGSRLRSRPRAWKAVVSEDSSGRVFFGITSELDVYDTTTVRRPSRKHAEYMLGTVATERYIDIPTAQPRVSFQEALKKVPGPEFRAAVIEAQYITWRRAGGNSIIPVWIITCYGYDNLMSHDGPPSLPKYMTHFIRTVVDATTGAMIFAANQPCAE